MTDQHPLTDLMIEELAEDMFYYEYYIPIFRQDLQVAYDKGRDDQLEQVIKWFKQSTSHYGGDCLYFDNHYDLDEGIGNVLEKAMRPQEDN